MARFMSSRPTPLLRTAAAVTTRPMTASSRLTPGANSRAQATTAATVDGEQVRRRRVEPIGIGVGARLLDDEDLLPQPQDRVELGDGQGLERAQLPAHAAS